MRERETIKMSTDKVGKRSKQRKVCAIVENLVILDWLLVVANS